MITRAPSGPGQAPLQTRESDGLVRPGRAGGIGRSECDIPPARPDRWAKAPWRIRLGPTSFGRSTAAPTDPGQRSSLPVRQLQSRRLGPRDGRDRRRNGQHPHGRLRPSNPNRRPCPSRPRSGRGGLVADCQKLFSDRPVRRGTLSTSARHTETRHRDQEGHSCSSRQRCEQYWLPERRL